MVVLVIVPGLVASAILTQAETPVRMVGGWLAASDYPRTARGASGTAVAQLTVGTNGRVMDCTIGQSSGNVALDRATCPIILERHRFRPATRNGQPVVGNYRLSIHWRPPRR